MDVAARVDILARGVIRQASGPAQRQPGPFDPVPQGSTAALVEGALEQLGEAGLLEIDRVVIAMGESGGVDNVSFTLRRGERLGLVGESGCGKSTLLEILAGRLQPDAGTITVRVGEQAFTLAGGESLECAY